MTPAPRLAPLYDVLPMAFAPRSDELPDEYLAPRALDAAPEVAPWVSRLAALVASDDELSPAFQERWLRHVGALR